MNQMVTARTLAGTQTSYWRYKMTEQNGTTELDPANIKYGDMLRKTGENLFNLMQQMAAKIDQLEEENLELREKLANATNG